MKLIHKLLNHVRYASSSKLVLGALFIAVSGIALGANLLVSNNAASAETCKTNNIMPCGYNSVSEFVSKYKSNNPSDMKAIYAAYGLSSDEIDRFAKTAKAGLVYKNGNITVDGKVVAKNATNLGREKGAGYDKAVNIGGKTYYSGSTQNTFAADKLPALVMMNGDKMEFAVMNICGNPLPATPTGEAPKYSCDMLNSKQINRTTYSYTTNVTALNGAKVAKLVYEFGDGSSKTVTNPSEAVTHTYAKEGTYTTKVTVYVNVNGETKAVTAAKCAKPVEVKPVPQTPTYVCDQLTATTISKEKRQYRFTAKTSVSGGAKLVSANFNFGDSQTLNDVKPSDASTVSAEHTYAKAGSYTITATVKFTVGSDTKTATCKVQVTPENQPPEECKPGIPVGDSRCEEAKECKPGIPEGDKRCEECKPGVPVGDKACEETPAELPNTGAGLAIGGLVGTGALGMSLRSYLNSRRNLRNAFKR